MKKFFTSLFVLAASIANAQTTFTAGDYKYTVLEGNTVEVSGAASSDLTVVNIPETVENEGTTYTVVAVGRYSFGSSITSVTLPKTVEKIKDHAFFGSSMNPKLTTVSFAEGLKYIGEGAFYGNAIEDLTIPASVDTIAGSAFLYSNKLANITFNEGLKYIGDGAFASGTYKYNTNTTLTSVKLPSTLEYLGSEAFINNSALASINIPASLITLGDCAIAGTSVSDITIDEGCTNFVKVGDVVYNSDKTILYLAPVKGLTSVSVVSSCLGINGGAFWDSELESIILPEGLVAIGFGAFENSQLKSINFPSTLTFIDEQAFAQTKFTELTLPQSVTYINDAEIYQCEQLTTLTIPSGVKEIYNHALTGCTSLKTIYAKSATAPTIMDYYETYYHPFFNFSPSSTTIYVPKGATDSYKSEGYDEYMTIVENELGTIVPVSTSPADSSSLQANYNAMSFELKFEDKLTLIESEPKVTIRKGTIYNANAISPDMNWVATVSGQTLTVWGADYDYFTCTYSADEDATYYVVIPEGIVKNEAGEENEQVVLTLFGPKSTVAIDKVEDAPVAGNAAVYNLMGQKVNANTKGLLIKNGKKYINK